MLDHDEIMQVFALRGQQRGVDSTIGRDLLDIIRDEPLQKTAPVRSRNGENAAILQHNENSLVHAGDLIICARALKRSVSVWGLGVRPGHCWPCRRGI